MTGPKFFAEALAEYEDAVADYEQRKEGLGARLIEELDQALAVVLSFPEAFAVIPDVPPDLGLRSILLRTFPIKLVYTVLDDALLVVAVFHARRRPGYWLERLKRFGK